MKYSCEQTAVVIGGGKDAALYFDWIVPLSHFWFKTPQPIGNGKYELTGSLDESIPENLNAVLPPDFVAHGRPFDVINGLRMVSGSRKVLDALTDPGLIDVFSKQVPEAFDSVPAEIIRDWIEYIAKRHAEGKLSFYWGTEGAPQGAVVSPALLLANVSVIDTTQATLEQILEARKDPERMKKLRRLRRWVFEISRRENSPDYIRDLILETLEDHDRAAGELGFKMRLTNWRTLLAGFGGVISASAAALAGLDPWATALVGAATAGLEVARNMTLTTVETRHNIGQLSGREVAYIVETRELLDATNSELASQGQRQLRE